jgi:hypothetical protein
MSDTVGINVEHPRTRMLHTVYVNRACLVGLKPGDPLPASAKAKTTDGGHDATGYLWTGHLLLRQEQES